MDTTFNIEDLIEIEPLQWIKMYDTDYYAQPKLTGNVYIIRQRETEKGSKYWVCEFKIGYEKKKKHKTLIDAKLACEEHYKKFVFRFLKIKD